MNFNELLTNNTRQDEYVNATKLCKAFGKRLDLWKKAEHTKSYISVLNDHLNSFTPNGGKVESMYTQRGVGTFIHPLLAIHLAKWLSPEFSLFVNKTFKKFIDADVELTKNLISRTESLEDIEAIQEKTKIQRQYLRSEFALNYEGGLVEEEHKAPWFTPVVKRYNNDCSNTKDGERSMMAENDKATLLFMQLAQAKNLERRRKSDNPYLSANNAKLSCYEIAKKTNEIMYGSDAPKPRDYDRMSKSDRKQLDQI